MSARLTERLGLDSASYIFKQEREVITEWSWEKESGFFLCLSDPQPRFIGYSNIEAIHFSLLVKFTSYDQCIIQFQCLTITVLYNKRDKGSKQIIKSKSDVELNEPSQIKLPWHFLKLICIFSCWNPARTLQTSVIRIEFRLLPGQWAQNDFHEMVSNRF